jgi:branched-subunit amino acid ABC-type transport system permease component
MSAAAFGANTLGVLAGCMLFGALAGAVGTFVLARRRALVADVAGHAALPGVALAFLAGEALGLGGRTAWLLLLGGASTALLAAWCVPALARLRRVGPDAATAVVLAGFFGLGAVLFSIVQNHPAGSQGGLRTLLFGSAAAMSRGEVVALTVLVRATPLGRARRAVAQDPVAATLMGVDVERVIAATFFLGGFLGGAASVVHGLTLTTIGFQMGFLNGLYAFTAAVLGGIGSVPGAVVGGLVIGLVRALSSLLVGERWTGAVVFGILIVILVFRPEGLLGRRTVDKV